MLFEPVWKIDYVLGQDRRFQQGHKVQTIYGL